MAASPYSRPEPPSSGAPGNDRLRQYLVGSLALAAMIALSVASIVAPIPYHVLGNYGYLGVFLITLVATAAMIAPVPYLAAIIIAGSFLNPIGVAAAGGAAAVLGELVGYAAGYGGRALIPKNRWVRQVQRAMARFGVPVMFLASLIPNPFFDVVGVIAGATRVPVWMFIVCVGTGKGLRFFLLATVGQPLLGPLVGG
ncbi:MAG: DedA family protein [Chloroflexi bacterium]|nr:DedA family protein [Chloroflexota bacterium]